MSTLSNRVTSMATSATLAMAAKARELRATGKDIIKTEYVYYLLKRIVGRNKINRY